MTLKKLFVLTLLIAALLFALPLALTMAPPFELPFKRQATQAKSNFQLTTINDSVSVPWAMAWLPNGDMLVTERRGRLLRLRGSEVIARVDGVPKVRAKGQGGLLDIALHPDFKTNQLVYFSYSDPTGGGGGNTAIARAKYSNDA